MGEALLTALPPLSHRPLRLRQARRLLAASLPLPVLDAPTALALVAYYQRRAWAAYRSHRRRFLQHLLSTAPP